MMRSPERIVWWATAVVAAVLFVAFVWTALQWR